MLHRKAILLRKMSVFMKNDFLVLFLALFFISLSFHFIYSGLGFNPTDDGFILAGAKRIFNGEIPHRDFISIRPAGSYILHSFVFLFKEDIFMLSRFFVLIQFGLISFFWVYITSKFYKTNLLEKLILLFLGIVFGLHSFPLMAWNTIDAIFFASLGLVFYVRFKEKAWFSFIIMGFSVLFRQNFILLYLFLPLVGGFRKELKNSILFFIPALIYVILIGFFGGFSDLIIQLSGHSFLATIRTGFIGYIFNVGFVWGLLSGYLISKENFLLKNKKEVMSIFIFIGFFAFFIEKINMVDFYSFLLLGIAIGLYINIAKKSCSDKNLFLITIILSWVASLSLGYNTPALSLAPLVIVLTAHCFAENFLSKNYNKIIAIIFLFIIVLGFNIGRTNNIYREQSKENLNYDLENYDSALKGIFTNFNTYSYLMDLKNLTNYYDNTGFKYSILPDNAFYWSLKDKKNLISIDWANEPTEIPNGFIFNRILEEIKNKERDSVIIIQKYKAGSISSKIEPLDDKEYRLISFVKKHTQKINETDFFEVYR